MADSEYLLRPRPPVRAFAVAATASLLGAVVLVLAGIWKWHVAFAVLGWLLLIAGVLLALAALVAMGRLTTRLVLGDEGYRLVGPRGAQEGEWVDVTRVTQSDDGDVITIHHGDDARDRLVFNNPSPAYLDRLLQDMGRRLDEAKGYRPFT